MKSSHEEIIYNLFILNFWSSELMEYVSGDTVSPIDFNQWNYDYFIDNPNFKVIKSLMPENEITYTDSIGIVSNLITNSEVL